VSDLRESVVVEALSWVRTPYHHAQRIKHVAVDCAHLLIGVYSTVAAVPEFDPGYYPIDWHLHREFEVFMLWVEEFAYRIDESAVLPADIVLYRFGRCFSHGAIVIEWPTIVHAVRKLGKVVVDEGDNGNLVGRERIFYRLKQL